ncbi:unnamed protein product [Peniophora sp. CBMAI 1063]|nr:unnamed protein product [Peniophora sp. CBMAI 1063]
MLEWDDDDIDYSQVPNLFTEEFWSQFPSYLSQSEDATPGFDHSAGLDTPRSPTGTSPYEGPVVEIDPWSPPGAHAGSSLVRAIDHPRPTTPSAYAPVQSTPAQSAPPASGSQILDVLGPRNGPEHLTPTRQRIAAERPNTPVIPLTFDKGKKRARTGSGSSVDMQGGPPSRKRPSLSSIADDIDISDGDDGDPRFAEGVSRKNKNWGDKELTRLFEAALGIDAGDVWKLIRQKKWGDAFKKVANGVFKGSRSASAMEAQYRKALKTFRLVHEFMSFTGGGGDPDVPIIDEAAIEKRLDQLRSRKKPAGRLSVETVQKWQKLGWYDLFWTRYKKTGEISRKVERHPGRITPDPTDELDEELDDDPLPSAASSSKMLVSGRPLEKQGGVPYPSASSSPSKSARGLPAELGATMQGMVSYLQEGAKTSAYNRAKDVHALLKQELRELQADPFADEEEIKVLKKRVAEALDAMLRAGMSS